MFEIYTTSNFDRELKKLSKKYPSIISDFKVLLKTFEDQPFQDSPLGRDCYKIRMAVSSKNRGKSGGSRIITCVKIINNSITLLLIYDKSDQNNISDKVLVSLLEENNLK
ncbi:type II toxin-antitoxin system RelE/ParE family toxin [Dyadobacter sp. CY356]|uniref:type II toxin-antitoxin system RelE/ParE family toxin n=1 Tax=Dyadobacter sp. CY356 TaxID=2906442 RepID=UPI001F35A3EA|nr:type II toxin-antitoxin system RelE/ParE family toxin [Dyadobacter sp. CY356]MCF0058511.1 type II toxin-antitoxin system RelE/ParE family toxin [Dyadobacter sp. CY356]